MRRAVQDDADFLRRVYFSSRASEIAAFGWTPEQGEQFLHMQYRMRSQVYAAAYPEAESFVIFEDGVDAGVMTIAKKEAEIRLVDIAFLGEYRGRGLGTAALQTLIGEARARSIPVRLSVARGNPAIHLYERLGFSVVSSDAMYIEMERQTSEHQI
jgi:ribosomal protein S18 acetylase RimI-like enzyme